MKTYKLNCWFDGACGPNNPGGYMGIGYLMKFSNTPEILVRISKGFPIAKDNTNNVAEQLALRELLLDLMNVKDALLDVVIRGDSQLTINQVSGRYKIKDKGLWFHKLSKENKSLVADLRLKGHNISFLWVRREENAEADKLSKQGIDKSYQLSRFEH